MLGLANWCTTTPPATALTDAGGPKNSTMLVIVKNLSSRPAHDVRIAFAPISPITEVHCDAKYTMFDGPRQIQTVSVDRIPGKGFLQLEVVSNVKEFPETGDVTLGHKRSYIGRVWFVQTDFGYVPCDDKKCVSAISPLSDDKELDVTDNSDMFGEIKKK